MNSVDLLIKTQDLIVYYSGIAVNKSVSFKLEYSELGVLTGGNGSGKTSVLKALTGQLKSYSGNASVLGLNPKDNYLWKYFRSGLRYVPQFPILPEVLDVNSTIEIIRKELISKEIKLNYDEFCDFLFSVDIDLSNLIEELSFGQRRIIELSIALFTKPKLIIADEPLAGLSPQIAKIVSSKLENFVKKGGSALITSHFKQQDIFCAKFYLEILPYKENIYE